MDLPKRIARYWPRLFKHPHELLDPEKTPREIPKWGEVSLYTMIRDQGDWRLILNQSASMAGFHCTPDPTLVSKTLDYPRGRMCEKRFGNLREGHILLG
jgi:hypothetical protein